MFNFLSTQIVITSWYSLSLILSVIISSTLMLFMTKVTSRRFKKNLNWFSIMLLYQELGLDSFQRSRWFRKLFQFYKIFKKNHLDIFLILFQLNKSSQYQVLW